MFSVIVSNGHNPSSKLASKLTSLYIQFNDFGSSVSVVKAMTEANTFVWNSVIKAHVKSGLIESAFCVLKLMRKMGVSCDSYTFPILTQLAELENGVCYVEMIHCVAMQMGFESDAYFCNTMIEAYTKNRLFGNALKVFDAMPSRDLVSWTSMISGYAYEGNLNGMFRLFNDMRKDVEPNEVTMIVMLQSCSSLARGRQLHCYVLLQDKALQEQNNVLAKKIKEKEKVSAQTKWEQQNHDLNSSCFDLTQPWNERTVDKERCYLFCSVCAKLY